MSVKKEDLLLVAVRPYLKWVVISVLAALTLVSFNIFKAALVGNMVETALRGDAKALSRILFLLVPSVAIATMATWGSAYASRHASILAVRDLKARLVAHITRAKVPAIESMTSGEIITRVNGDTATVREFLSEHFPNMLFQPLMLICSSLYLISISWKLFVGSYILLPVSFMCANALNKRSASYSQAYYEGLDDVTTRVKQCLDGMVTVKTYNLGSHMLKRCRDSFDRVLGSLMKREKCDSVSLPFYFLTYESPRILCVVVGGLLTWQGEMTLGELIAATQLVSYVSAPAIALMRLMNAMRRVRVATARLHEVFDLEQELQAGEDVAGAKSDACVEFCNVSFSYDSNNPVLKDVSFTVSSRGVTALVGASGEGKSTAMSLLARFYEPEAGEIRLLGQNVLGHGLSELRDRVAYVSQDSQLFPGTITENILMGNGDAGEDEVAKVTSSCHVDEFAAALPAGLETLLGERGAGLSGGQRQRVALARAAIKGAPVVLLDEPTAALDGLSETLINNTIRAIGKKSAVLMASHRLSTVMTADHIVVLEKGTVVEEGTYQELVQNNGPFTRVFGDMMGEVTKDEL